MSLMVVIRHTRAEEETGRAELIGATAVGRHAIPAAAVVAAAAPTSSSRSSAPWL